MEDNFLTQLVSEFSRGGALLDLLFTDRGLVGHVVVGSRLGLSDHEMPEFSILGELQRRGQGNHHHGLLEGRLWPAQDTG